MTNVSGRANDPCRPLWHAWMSPPGPHVLVDCADVAGEVRSQEKITKFPKPHFCQEAINFMMTSCDCNDDVNVIFGRPFLNDLALVKRSLSRLFLPELL